ncbi:hypothetical protein KDA_22470 [Dictyobacter alpinus]|uniref:DUF4291 domain-containing protein n=1 Tax=Dictyobacter alpinus TaxID=2014873 RepID=A0A402B5Y6_9CHLR|nr:DUF4291 domain-containing protein [Dictyobacter alpinus]GCE26763.1 hypothetical protein KDA_22470 [Dictyobacter alpinus]
MKLEIVSYLEQKQHWPERGQHIMAQFDNASIIVYQAYKPTIGHFAARNGYFGGNRFSFERMSWIKPNFLWMMYRNGWGKKENQEVTLAIRLQRAAFDSLLEQAVPSSYWPDVYPSEAAWKQALEASSVRLQWDPDHGPAGQKLERRAIQLGLRGPVLEKFAREWIIDIEDISEFVRQQHQHVLIGDYTHLLTPRETVYPFSSPI